MQSLMSLLLPAPCVTAHPQNHRSILPPTRPRFSDPHPLNLPRVTHPQRGTDDGWVNGLGLGGGRGLGKWEPPWEFPCQRAHLTASPTGRCHVPQGPDGIQWSAR